jgi:predicted permease
MRLEPGRAGYTGDRRTAYFDEVLRRVRAMPGVEHAALSLGMPVVSAGIDSSIAVDGLPRHPDALAFVNEVSDGYFDTSGTKLLLGRDFGPEDRRGSPAAGIVNEAFARRYFGDRNPIGQRVTVGIRGMLEVVGVVETTKYESLREADSPIVYGHVMQGGSLGGGLSLTVKATGDPLAIAPAVRRAVQEIAPVPVAAPATLSALIDRTLVKERLIARVLGAFALLAALLAGAGLYGVLAYMVARRTGEIGVRLALGATRRAVLRPVIAESMTLVTLGLAVGVPVALTQASLLSTLLYGVTTTDARVLGGVALSLVLVALAASSVPAWRASRVDPLIALRAE